MCLKCKCLSVCFSNGIVYSLAICFHSSLVMFSRFSHASLAACGELLRVALSAALVRSATDVASSATFPFRMAYSSAKGYSMCLGPLCTFVYR